MSLSKLNENKWPIIIIGTPVVIFGIWYWRGSSRQTDPATDQKKKDDQNVPEPKSKVVGYKLLKDEGNVNFKNGNYEVALSLYAKAMEDCPVGEDLAALYQNRAAVFEKLGDHAKVIQESSKALEINNKYVKALHRRSRAFKHTGFLEEALEDITAVCILEMFTIPSSIQHADEVLKQLGKSEADKLMKQKKPSKPSEHSVAAFLRSFYNDPVTKSLSDEWEDDGSFYSKAVLNLKNAECDSLLQNCQKEIANENSVHLVKAHHLLATFKFLYGDETCVQHFDFVAANGNQIEQASALIKRASYFALSDSGDYAKSFEDAAKLTPQNADVYHHRGQVLLTKGNMEEAMREIEKAADMCPDFALATATKWFVTYRVACMHQNSDVMNSSMRHFQKCVKKFPNSPDIFNLYGQILMENRLFLEAEEQFDKVIQLEPNNTAVYVHKAMAQFSMTSDHDKALKILKDSLEIDDRNEFVWETIGTLELQVGNLQATVEAIGRALELAKSHQELMMLSSLKKAAEVQRRVKDKLGIEIPAVNNIGGSGSVPLTAF